LQSLDQNVFCFKITLVITSNTKLYSDLGQTQELARRRNSIKPDQRIFAIARCVWINN